MMTYTDFFQFCTFVISLVGVCYTIFSKRKKPPTTTNSERLLKQLLRVGRFFWLSLLCFEYNILPNKYQGFYARVEYITNFLIFKIKYKMQHIVELFFYCLQIQSFL